MLNKPNRFFVTLLLAACGSAEPSATGSVPTSAKPDASTVAAKPAASAASSATQSATASTQASTATAPPPPPNPNPVARPCEITLVSAPNQGQECLYVPRLQPEGEPMELCTAKTKLSYRYDTNGLITHAGLATYNLKKDRTFTRKEGKDSVDVQFDAAGRLIAKGKQKLGWDDVGRLISETEGKRSVQYKYAADGTFESSNNYPDKDEFCMPNLVEVKRDAAGRPAFDRFSGCQINYPLYTLSYEYDASSRIKSIGVDLQSDGSQELGVTLTYPKAGELCAMPTP